MSDWNTHITNSIGPPSASDIVWMNRLIKVAIGLIVSGLDRILVVSV